MSELVEFKFLSEYDIDNNKETIEFVSRGYKKIEGNRIIYYFKNDNSYKFIIEDNHLTVNVNDSIYEFDSKNKTEALIRTGEYSYKASVITHNLQITDKRIDIGYVLDFNSFKGVYKITLELL